MVIRCTAKNVQISRSPPWKNFKKVCEFNILSQKWWKLNFYSFTSSESLKIVRSIHAFYFDLIKITNNFFIEQRKFKTNLILWRKVVRHSIHKININPIYNCCRFSSHVANIISSLYMRTFFHWAENVITKRSINFLIFLPYRLINFPNSMTNKITKFFSPIVMNTIKLKNIYTIKCLWLIKF